MLALHNAWSTILAAIFAGNAVVLKCSEHVIWSTTWFVGAIKACLRACQFDPELVQASRGEYLGYFVFTFLSAGMLFSNRGGGLDQIS
jgi:hypothetical protein